MVTGITDIARTAFGTSGIIVSCKMLEQKMIHIARTTSIETAQKKRWMTC